MKIEVFDNPAPVRDYIIQHIADEFTSVCPKTGHPDFGTMILSYVPDRSCVELKAYKLYLQEFRTRGIFYEAVTNEIFDCLWNLLEPRWMRLESVWRGRGGIRTTIRAEGAQDDYRGPTAEPANR